MKGVALFNGFLGAFSLIGVAMLGYAAWAAWRSTQAAHWPTTPGTITRVHLKVHSDEGTSYQVEVEYRYSVAGENYQGSRLAFGYAGSGNQQTHSELFHKLEQAQQQGQSIEVRYAPHRPDLCTLAYGIHSSIRNLALFGIVWLVMVLGMLSLVNLAARPDTALLDTLSVR